MNMDLCLSWHLSYTPKISEGFLDLDFQFRSLEATLYIVFSDFMPKYLQDYCCSEIYYIIGLCDGGCWSTLMGLYQ